MSNIKNLKFWNIEDMSAKTVYNYEGELITNSSHKTVMLSMDAKISEIKFIPEFGIDTYEIIIVTQEINDCEIYHYFNTIELMYKGDLVYEKKFSTEVMTKGKTCEISLKITINEVM